MNSILLLWDIDGTLLNAGGAGEAALKAGLFHEFGVTEDLADIEIAGRTDTSICATLAQRHSKYGVTSEKMLEAYLKHLPHLLPKYQGHVCPGIKELLDWAHKHTQVHNALLTGNVSRGAKIKLSYYHLDSYFEFGAFGEDSSHRNDLGPIALERARKYLGKEFKSERTWVIGDTAHDVACARAAQCKALAVATGRFSVDELSVYQPDLLLSNFLKTQEVIQKILSVLDE